MNELLKDEKVIEKIKYLLNNYPLKDILNSINYLKLLKERDELIEKQMLEDMWDTINDDESSGFYFDIIGD